MFASILKLFGISAKSKQIDKAAKSDKLQEQISKSIEDFKNRPIHRVLTTELIDSIPDHELLQAVFDNLNEQLPADHTKEKQTMVSWTKAQQAIFIIWCLEAEVNNGGFNQFYANPGGQYADLVPDALLLVGAVEFADLAKRANEANKKEFERITMEQDGSLKGFSKSYEDNPLNEFDDEFYEICQKEDLQKVQVRFIRNTRQEFIDK